jgi:hypothetical protein
LHHTDCSLSVNLPAGQSAHGECGVQLCASMHGRKRPFAHGGAGLGGGVVGKLGIPLPLLSLNAASRNTKAPGVGAVVGSGEGAAVVFAGKTVAFRVVLALGAAPPPASSFTSTSSMVLLPRSITVWFAVCAAVVWLLASGAGGGGMRSGMTCVSAVGATRGAGVGASVSP